MSYEWTMWVLKGLLLASPFLAVIAWEEWEARVRPWLIPPTEIDAIASDLLTKYGDGAIARTYLEEDRALYETDSYTAAKWRRVRARLLWP